MKTERRKGEGRDGKGDREEERGKGREGEGRRER